MEESFTEQGNLLTRFVLGGPQDEEIPAHAYQNLKSL